MDEPTLLRIRRAIQDGRIKRSTGGGMPVFMGLQGEDGYPFEGHINFFNNQVNAATGSISLRGIFPNPQPDVPRLAGVYFGMFASPSGWEPLQALAMPASGKLPGGIRLMSPGMFVRIRLPIGYPHKALLVIDRAIQSDQGLKYVYLIGADGKAEYRRVTTGSLQPNGLREIRAGLTATDWVAVGALQQVRPRMVVQPEQTTMPTLNSSGEIVSNPSAPPLKKTGKRLHALALFIDRPIFATVLSVVITLIGGIALLYLPIAQYPRITPPGVSVSITYPGRQRQVVADTVAAPIEQQVNGVEGMLYMSSQMGNDGTYSLTVTFDVGTDLKTALVMVQNRVHAGHAAVAYRRCRTRASPSARRRPTS